eukprot:gene29518-5868_t
MSRFNACDQIKANLKPCTIQAKPSLKPSIAQVKVHATLAHVDQNKADTKIKRQCYSWAALIPEEEMAAELEAIHKELASKVWCSQVFSFLNAVLHRPPMSIRPSACASVLGPTSVSLALETQQRQHIKEYATSAHVGQGMAYFKPSQIQANPSHAKLQAYENDLRRSRYFSTCGQDKAGNKRKNRSFPKEAPIPQEKRVAELEAIQKELVTDLGMAQDIASKVLKQAAKSRQSTSVLSLENCRGWITNLRQLGLDEKGVIQGLQGSPIILACSAAGREEANIEVLTVLEQAGLRSDQVMHVLQKYPAVLLFLPATLAQRLDRLASMGFPPGSDCGPFLKRPMIINASLQFNIVEWLTAKGFPEHLIQRMILSTPTLLMSSPGNLGPMLEYVAWVVGSKETAVELLTKQPSIFRKRPTSIHAKMLMLKELVGCSPSLILTRNYVIATRGMHTFIGPRCILLRELGLAEVAEIIYRSSWFKLTHSNFATWPTLVQAYHDMGRERFPTTNSLEDAIVVCQERWDYEWKAKFDERLLMMQAKWKVSGIAGLPAIENQMWKEKL